MAYRLHRCAGAKDNDTACGKIITWSFAICSECEKKYGNSPYDWPEWLRDSWKAEQRLRRRNNKQDNHELTFTDLEFLMQSGDDDE